MANKNNKPSENALLTEYQVCQQDNSSQSGTYWLIFSIFIGITTLVLVALLFGLIERRIVPIGPTRVVILLVGVVMILVLILLLFWLSRTDFFIGVNRKRMLDIERTLDMRAKRVVEVLTNQKSKDKDFDSLIERYKPEAWFEKLGRFMRGRCIALILFGLLILSWIGVIIASCTVFDP